MEASGHKKWVRMLEAAAFLVPLALYLATICPTVHLGDSGELNLAASTLGIPHVPGYPTLVNISHAVTRLPLGNGAFKGNLFSVLFGAASCWLFYRLLNLLFARPLVSFSFAIALAGSFTLWEQSLKIRAYPANTFFAIGIILLTLLWRREHDRRFLYALALWSGIGLANHEILLVTGMVPLAALVADYKHLRVVDVVAAAAFGLLGLSIYGYLYVRAQANPVLNWGDPNTFERLIDVLLQKQYAGKMMTGDRAAQWLLIKIILNAFVEEFGPVVLVFGLLGILVAAKKNPVLLIGLALLVLANIGLRINYIGDQEEFQVLRYMTASFVAFLIAAAFCVDYLMRRIGEAPFAPGSKQVMIALILAATAIFPTLIHRDKTDLSNHRIGYDYINAVLSYPENDYVLSVGGDNNIFPIWYLQKFERYAEHVVPFPVQTFRADWLEKEVTENFPDVSTDLRIRYVDLPMDRRFYSTLDRLAARHYPLYSIFETTAEEGGGAAMQDLRERFGLTPCGLLFRFGDPPNFCAPDSELWNRFALDLMERQDLYRDHHSSDLLENVSVMLSHRGSAFEQAGEMNEAIRSFQQAIRVMPTELTPAVNLANVLARTGHPAEALRLYSELLRQHGELPVLLHNIEILESVLKGKGAP